MSATGLEHRVDGGTPPGRQAGGLAWRRYSCALSTRLLLVLGVAAAIAGAVPGPGAAQERPDPGPEIQTQPLKPPFDQRPESAASPLTPERPFDAAPALPHRDVAPRTPERIDPPLGTMAANAADGEREESGEGGLLGLTLPPALWRALAILAGVCAAAVLGWALLQWRPWKVWRRRPAPAAARRIDPDIARKAAAALESLRVRRSIGALLDRDGPGGAARPAPVGQEDQGQADQRQEDPVRIVLELSPLARRRAALARAASRLARRPALRPLGFSYAARRRDRLRSARQAAPGAHGPAQEAARAAGATTPRPQPEPTTRATVRVPGGKAFTLRPPKPAENPSEDRLPEKGLPENGMSENSMPENGAPENNPTPAAQEVGEGRKGASTLDRLKGISAHARSARPGARPLDSR